MGESLLTSLLTLHYIAYITFFSSCNVVRTNGHHRLKEHDTLGNQGECYCDMSNIVGKISCQKL